MIDHSRLEENPPPTYLTSGLKSQGDFLADGLTLEGHRILYPRILFSPPES